VTIRVDPSAAGAPPELTVSSLTVRFSTVTALTDVNLTVRAGEVVALAGENGAGKTTLIRAVAGDVDGVLVTPMRSGGVELLAGVSVDPVFGPVLAVGLGGIWVELLADTSLRVLPVGPGEVRDMLGELRGMPLLAGARGTRPADLDGLARVIAALGETARSLNGGLRALEVNPLWVSGDQIEALDVLVVTELQEPSRTELGT